MKKELIGWYQKSEEELATIWETAIFVPDANILLHCIRYPVEARDTLLRLFEVISESLWIPYQVGLEFHRNRLNEVGKGRDAYDKLKKDCEKGFEQIKDSLHKLGAHPTIENDGELDALEKYMIKFNDRLESAEKRHPTSVIETVVDRITKLFEGRTGSQWSKEDRDKLKKEGETRYAQCVPPGYKDANKAGDEKYGDLVIWKDMIKKAKLTKRPIIFITDDDKEDWWWEHRGKKLGPRPELVEEFQREASQEFHIYKFKQFVHVAFKHHPKFKLGNWESNLDAIEKSLQYDSKAKDQQTRSSRFITAGELLGSIGPNWRERSIFEKTVAQSKSYADALHQLNEEIRGSDGISFGRARELAELHRRIADPLRELNDELKRMGM